MPTVLVLAVLICPPAESRSFQEIDRELRAALRDEVAARTGSGRGVAVVRLVRLYGEILRDARLASSLELRKYKTRAWSRLTRVKGDLKRHQGTATRRGVWNSRRDAGIAARGGRAGGGDYGPALVALIERTITPEFWDVNGGPGTVFYFRPSRVLVVRATHDVHHGVGGVLGGLR